MCDLIANLGHHSQRHSLGGAGNEVMC